MILGAFLGRTDINAPLPTKCLDATRELNDYINAHHKSSLCPEIIKDYAFSGPQRKELCTDLVFDIIECTTRIIERECGIIRI